MQPTQKSVLIVAVATALVAAGAVGWILIHRQQRADPDNAAQVATGQVIYHKQCAQCHGAKLQGEADWTSRKANGRLPAPPHDASGHTWHHVDAQLFAIVKHGLKPFAPAGYKSDMPAFESTLSDGEIWAVLAFIKGSWPPEIRQRQREMSEQAKN